MLETPTYCPVSTHGYSLVSTAFNTFQNLALSMQVEEFISTPCANDKTEEGFHLNKALILAQHQNCPHRLSTLDETQ